MSSKAKDKAIIITGGAAGIGLATARMLSAQGWFVGLIDVSEEALAAAKAQIPNGRVAVATADVTDAESFAVALESIAEVTGGFSAIFNNAGIARDGGFDDVPLSDHQQTIAVNATGVVNGCHLAIPHLRRQTGVKHIINMSSASTIYGIPGLSSYSATKAFVEYLSEALSIELAGDDIQLNTIAVPFVQTAMIDFDSEAMEQNVKAQGKLIQPDDVANRVAAILEGRASRRIHQLISGQLKLQHLLKRLLPMSALHNIVARSYRKARSG